MLLMNLASGLIIVGALLLAAALFPVARVIAALPSGGLRVCWYGLASMVVAFICCYAVTAFSGPGLLVSWVFFFGGVFVLTVSILSQRTAHYSKRLAVLKRESMTDALMQIYNRRYLDARLKNDCSRSQQTDKPLSVLLLDIDRFKGVNDRYGHVFGDAVLRQFGPLVVQSVRQTDTVARYGGEEIMIVARNTDSIVAAELAERIRSIVSATHFLSASADGSEVTEAHITASIGVATLRQAESVQSLIRRADEALYSAKDEGRNRVVVSSRLSVVPKGITGPANSVASTQPQLYAVEDRELSVKVDSGR